MPWVSIVVALLLVAPGVARAQVSLGLRAGYAAARGDVGGELEMAEWVSGQLPVQADLLVRVSRRVSVGAYASYGFGLASGEAKFLCNLLGCTPGVVRAGVQAVYELPARAVAPWVGAGFGYEWNITSFAPHQAGPPQVTLGGVEWLSVQGGVNRRVARRLVLGPFVMASLGRYGSGSVVSGGFGGAPSERAFHGWWQLGVRARFDL